MYCNINIGKQIRYYRLLNNLSQEDLAKKINTDARTISNYERGKYKPCVDAVILLSETFGISIDKLLLESINNGRSHSLVEEREIRDLVLKIVDLPNEDKNVVKNLVEHLILKNSHIIAKQG